MVFSSREYRTSLIEYNYTGFKKYGAIMTNEMMNTDEESLRMKIHFVRVRK